MGNAKTIDERISNALPEIEHHLKKLPFMPNPSIEWYVFPNIEIADVIEREGGRKIAKVTAHINKAKMPYWMTEMSGGEKVSKGPYYFDSLDQYWDLGIKLQMTRTDVSNSDKAIFLTQFKTNLENSYGQTKAKTVDALKKVIDEMYKITLEAKTESNEPEFYETELEHVELKDPALKDTRTLRIGNFLKGLFLDEKNYAKIKQHEREGRFKKGENCIITMYRPIAYQ